MTSRSNFDLQATLEEAESSLVAGQLEDAVKYINLAAAISPRSQRVLYLRRCVALMSLRFTLQRAGITRSPRTMPPQNTVELVSFHVNLDSAPSGIHASYNYMEVQRLSFEAARLRAPAARLVLLTDMYTQVSPDLPVDRIVRFSIDRRYLMYERMRIQEQFLQQREDGVSTVFVDSDLVLNGDPCQIFDCDADVSLTWRPEFLDSPFNGGMIAVAAGAAGKRFFSLALEVYDQLAGDDALSSALAADLRSWWGDQFALAHVVGYPEFFARKSDAMSVGGVKIRFLPCEKYNFTIEGGVKYSKSVLEDKLFFHFKGNRKVFQKSLVDAMKKRIF